MTLPSLMRPPQVAESSGALITDQGRSELSETMAARPHINTNTMATFTLVNMVT